MKEEKNRPATQTQEIVTTYIPNYNGVIANVPIAFRCRGVLHEIRTEVHLVIEHNRPKEFIFPNNDSHDVQALVRLYFYDFYEHRNVFPMSESTFPLPPSMAPIVEQERRKQRKKKQGASAMPPAP